VLSDTAIDECSAKLTQIALERPMTDKILAWFVNLWLFLIFVITMLAFARLWTEAPTFSTGLLAIVDEASNYKLYLTIALFSSPALVAMWWREKRRTRTRGMLSQASKRPTA
jgi:hypothetical protein